MALFYHRSKLNIITASDVPLLAELRINDALTSGVNTFPLDLAILVNTLNMSLVRL